MTIYSTVINAVNYDPNLTTDPIVILPRSMSGGIPEFNLIYFDACCSTALIVDPAICGDEDQAVVRRGKAGPAQHLPVTKDYE
jgi:hypothetical protein